jgi:hypothetical protein
VIAEHKVGVAGSLAQRVARDGKYASQVEPVEQHEAPTGTKVDGDGVVGEVCAQNALTGIHYIT